MQNKVPHLVFTVFEKAFARTDKHCVWLIEDKLDSTEETCFEGFCGFYEEIHSLL